MRDNESMEKYTNAVASNALAVYERINPSVVVTVDEHDTPIGIMDKMEAHTNGGSLHRAFSIFVFDRKARLLLQRRASSKYHFGGLWTNSCCGHAVPGESLRESAAIRLWQEMHICTNITEVRPFTYVADDYKTGLTEREIDHVFSGMCEDVPEPDPREVDDWRWVSIGDLDDELVDTPGAFTPWFRLGLNALSGNSR